ncbi:MAG: hypothetical protein ABS948_03700 [Solibacillus sp.]
MKFIPIIVLGLILGVLAAMFDWPIWVAFLIILAVGLVPVVKMLHAAYFTTNLDTMRRYLQKNKKDPMCEYALTMEFGTKEDEVVAIDKILARYRQPVMQHTYEMNKAMRLDDYTRAGEFAEKLGTHAFGTYGKASIAAMQGQASEARSYTLKEDWMKSAVEAMIAYAARDMHTFRKHGDAAIEKTKGLQRYILVYSLKNMEQEAK